MEKSNSKENIYGKVQCSLVNVVLDGVDGDVADTAQSAQVQVVTVELWLGQTVLLHLQPCPHTYTDIVSGPTSSSKYNTA